MLGVPRDAPPSAIRAAYRERARLVHPDRGDDPVRTSAMASVNEAYRVLGDPGRRALYDRSLADDRATRAPGQAGDDVATVDDHRTADVRRRNSALSPPGPARVPWKLMAIAAAVGTALVLAAAAFTEAPADEPPDGILRSGSCVAIEPNGDAREVACTGDGDVVVAVLVPIAARCPVGTVGHRDRLGLGTACIEE